MARRAGAAEAKQRAALSLVVAEAERWRSAAGGMQAHTSELQVRLCHMSLWFSLEAFACWRGVVARRPQTPSLLPGMLRCGGQD